MFKLAPQVITIKTKQRTAVFGNVTKRDAGDDADHTIHLKAFGKEFVVPLKRNLNLLSPFANVVDTFLDPETGKIHTRDTNVMTL
jgi:hypothetical protein